MQQLSSTQASAEVPINENFESIGWAAVFGKRHPVTTGLAWGYWGGYWGGLTIADGSVALTNGATNYLVVERATGTVSVSTSAAAWNDPAGYARLYKLTVAGGVVTASEDHRAGLFGAHGFQIPERRVVSVSAAYGITLPDIALTLCHPSSDASGRTWTIPANATTPLPVGCELDLVNGNGAGAITLAITTDTMRLAGAGTTGSRTIAANGWARVKKIAATEWIVRGEGVS